MSLVCISSVSCLFPSSTSINRRQTVDPGLRCMIRDAQDINSNTTIRNILMKGL